MVRRRAIEGPRAGPNDVAAVPAAGEDEGCYAIRSWVETPIRGVEPDLAFVDEFVGSIQFYRDDGKRERVGRFRVYQIRLSHAWEAGWSPYDVLGSHSPQLNRYAHPLIDPKSGDFYDSIIDEFEVQSGKILALDCIEILPAHRGKGLGLAVASRLIDLLSGTPMVLVVCCPLPTQFCPTYGDLDRPDERFRAAMQFDRLPKSAPRSIGKLRPYWSKLGFRRVAKTDVYALSTSLLNPKLEDICNVSLL
jgi:hypothetical protein